MKVYLFFANNGFVLGISLMFISFIASIYTRITILINILLGIGFLIMFLGFHCLYNRKWRIDFTSLDTYKIVEHKEMTGRDAWHYAKLNNYAWELSKDNG